MMNTNIVARASQLSDPDLLARLSVLAGKEREATVELLAHLAELDSRPSLYASRGYGSLFSYCTHVLHLSEDAACNRIHAARACRRFPVILDLLAAGSMSLTSVRLLREHLTPENHETVLARARGRSRREIEALVAELAPRPDVPASVRRLPIPSVATVHLATPPTTATAAATPPSPESPASNAPPRPLPSLPALRRPVIETTSPERYRVQFTVGKETHDKLRRVQTLLRREIPDGDPGAIFDRAVTLLLERVERQKVGGAVKPQPSTAIRPGADKARRTHEAPRTEKGARRVTNSRYTAPQVKRAAWRHDAGQCGFVSADGQRCPERTFLEFHHVKPFAKGGPATVENISLRCRRHNQYEAELVFGPHGASPVREVTAKRASVNETTVVRETDGVRETTAAPGPPAP